MPIWLRVLTCICMLLPLGSASVTGQMLIGNQVRLPMLSLLWIAGVVAAWKLSAIPWRAYWWRALVLFASVACISAVIAVLYLGAIALCRDYDSAALALGSASLIACGGACWAIIRIPAWLAFTQPKPRP